MDYNIKIIKNCIHWINYMNEWYNLIYGHKLLFNFIYNSSIIILVNDLSGEANIKS